MKTITTMYDVAKRAGVSIASVSLTLKNPDTKRVGAEKRELIIRTAHELGYQPSGIARALSEGSTKILGLLVPMQDAIFVHPFIAEVLSGVQIVAAQNDYDLMIYSHLTETGHVTRRELVKCRYVDGMAVLNTRVSSTRDIEETIRALNRMGLPFVMINGYAGSEDINYVGIDDTRTGMIAAEYLARKGRKRFAVLAGTKRSPISADFLSGVRASLTAASITIPEEFLAYGEYNVQTAETIATRWFTARQVPDAILVIDEQMVPSVYRAVRQRGLTIGQDVSIISRGSAGFAESLEPKLATIEISGHQIGEIAARVLLQSLSKDSLPRQKIMLSSRLILNASA